MGDSSLDVITAELLSTASHATRIGAELSSGLESISHDVDQIAQTWTGLAGQSFGGAWFDVQASANDVLCALAGLAESLSASARIYEGQESENEREFVHVEGLA